MGRPGHEKLYSEMPQEIFYVDTDPNGNTSAERPAMAYSADGGVWVKTGQGNGADGWTQIISPEQEQQP